MSNLIPNEHVFIGFIPEVTGATPKPYGVANTASPTVAEIAGAIDLTDYVISLTASSSGNVVPTPRLKSLFETSISGTVTATFTGDFYRDDTNDLAWDTLPRAQQGSFIIKRFGGTGTGGRPAATQKCEVWPVDVVSRAAAALTSGQAQMFTLNCSVPKEPNENATVTV